MSEEDLVARARSGDLQAFDRLMSLHQNRVFSLAYRMLGNAEDAADVQQETFVRAWRSLNKFRMDSSFATWLHRITMNLCLTWKRRRRPENTETPLEDDRVRSTEPSHVTCLERAETAAMIRRTIDSLPAHHRALIVLREIEQRPYEEIAQVLGCSVESARMRASKARKVLRERLEPYLAEDMK